MPEPLQLSPQMALGGGLNLSADPLHVRDDETPDCLNVDFDQRGAVRKRNGFLRRGVGLLDDLDFVVPYRRSNGVSTLVVAARDAATRSMDTSFAFTTIPSSTQSASGINEGLVAGDSVWIVNNVDGTLRWDGTTATRFGTTLDSANNHPLAAHIAFHKSRLFLGNTGSGADKSRVYFTGSDSNPTDLAFVKSTSFIDFDPDDGDEITAIVPFLDQLTVFKSNKIFTLRGNDPRSFVKVLANPSLGCIAPRTAVPWDKGVLFLSFRGVFSFDGTKVVRVSEKIDPALQVLPSDTLRDATAFVFQNRYYLCLRELPTTTFNDTVYVFDFVTGTWTKYRGWNVHHAAIWNRVGGEEIFGVDSQFRGNINQYKIGSQDGNSSIEAHFTSKWLDFRFPEKRKTGRRLYAFFESELGGGINIDITKNYQDAFVIEKSVELDPQGMTWGESTWGEPTLWGPGRSVIRAKLGGLGSSTAFRIKVYDQSMKPWTLLGFSFVIQPRNLA